MTAKLTVKNIQQYWEDNIIAKVSEWKTDTTKGWLNRHLLLLILLFILCIFQYYVDQTPLTSLPFFSHNFFTGIHDINRVMFFIPVVYAALVYRVPGSLVSSFIFLGVVLPRALLFSPYSNPLLRALIFVLFSALVSLLIALELNRVERERKAQAALSSAYQKLSEYVQRLKESQEQLIQAEKLTSLGQLSASIAHEINNPLSGVLTYTQLLTKKINSDKFSKESALEYLSKMASELIRSTKLVRNLLDFARQSTPTLVETDLNDIVNRSLELVTHSAQLGQIDVLKKLDLSLPKLMADPNQLQQVCTNLILNAIQAMPGGGKLLLRTSADNNHLKIEVQDTGCGISQENMHKLFTPFFTTKKEVKGVGLGLAVSHGIVQRHHGRIEIQSKEGEGSTFTIYLPAHQ
jgi:signal transduction histidine kinase